jgi:ABC-type branched-subunit amino acid transport system substrate-binding protein
MRKTTIVVLAASLIVAATGCTTRSTSGSSDDTTGGSTTASDTRAVGITPTTIKLGITTLDLAAIKDLIDLDHGDAVTAYTAVINDINANGGINGRKIVPVFAPVNPSLASASAAACTKLTEDEKVFAVIGYFRLDDPLCYVHTHDTPIVGDSLTPVQQKQAKAPWFNTTLTSEHLIPKALAAFQTDGAFTGHKVAVVGMAQDAPDFHNVVLPALHKLGIPVVASAINDASINDLPAIYQQYGLISQKFKQAGADTVIAVGAASNSWPLAQQVLQTTYKPRLLALDYNNLLSYLDGSQGFDASLLTNALAAYGGMPDPKDVWTTPALQKCIALVTAAHPSEPVGDPTTAKPNTGHSPWSNAVTACQQVNLFAQIAKAAGKNLTNGSFLTGGESLKNITLPGGNQPLSYGPDSYDGNLPVTIYAWDPTTKTFVIKPTAAAS